MRYRSKNRAGIGCFHTLEALKAHPSIANTVTGIFCKDSRHAKLASPSGAFLPVS